MKLKEIAFARSGDKGASANIGVIAYTAEHYKLLCDVLTADKVKAFFKPLGVSEVVRYELPNLWALNFVLKNVLDGGGSVSLRLDNQGKTLGQAILEMPLPLSEEQ